MQPTLPVITRAGRAASFIERLGRVAGSLLAAAPVAGFGFIVLSLAAALVAAPALAGCSVPPTPTLIPFEQAPGDTPVPTSIDVAQAVFSVVKEPKVPQGTAVLFRDGRGLWVIEGDAEPRELLSGSVTDWRVAPDGSMVAALLSAAGGPRLDVLDMSSGEVMSSVSSGQLPEGKDPTESGSREIVAVEWRPDNEMLYVGTGYRGDTHAAVVDEVLAMDPQTAELSQLVPRGMGGIPLPAPDGSLVALTRLGPPGEPTAIAVATSDGQDLRELFEYPPIRSDSGVPDVRTPVWSGDGSALLLVLPGADADGQPWADSDHSEVVHIPVDGSEVQRVTIPLSGHASGRGIWWAPGAVAMAYTRESPEGTRAAPASPDPETAAPGAGAERRDLVIAAWDGSDEVVYATGDALRFLDWASDAEHFLYENNGALYVGRRGESPVTFGVPEGGSPRVAALVYPDHVLLLGQDLSVRTSGGDEAMLARDVGRFDVVASR
jgi:hypothetical protein